MIEIIRSENRIAVKSPYNPTLPQRARALGGSWDASKKVWVYDAADEELVRSLYMDVYGEWEGSQHIRVRITTEKDLVGRRDSVYICGVQIARAYGRDSGAKVMDAKFISGDLPTSGGSAKHWCTIVPAGAMFDIQIPQDRLADIEREGEDRGFTVQVVDEGQDRKIQNLRDERERLLARIAEIDAILEKEEE